MSSSVAAPERRLGVRLSIGFETNRCPGALQGEAVGGRGVRGGSRSGPSRRSSRADSIDGPLLDYAEEGATLAACPLCT